ncbi:hypothetical protein EDB86DRAFT_511458 [Lactarius hatsudake]|nr:hypothetical protein EDB86DRAFT_511458 [Lactarius hatsudake]
MTANMVHLSPSSGGVSLRARGVIFHYSPGVSRRSRARSRPVASRVAGSLVFDELTVLAFRRTAIHQTRGSSKSPSQSPAELSESGDTNGFATFGSHESILGPGFWPPRVIYSQTWLSALSMYSCLAALALGQWLLYQYSIHVTVSVPPSLVILLLVLTCAGPRSLARTFKRTLRLQHAMAYMGTGA